MAPEDDSQTDLPDTDQGQPPVKGAVKRSAKSESRKRELKSTKRKGGVPVLQKPKKKSRKWWWICGGLVVAFFAAVFLTPKVGTIHYGICKTYLELHDPYPSSLEYVQGYDVDNLVVIDYNRIDSFGQRSLNQIRCVFKIEGDVNQISRVDVNGKSNVYDMEKPEEVQRFNRGLPAIMQYSPSLIMPRGLPDDIKEYR